MNNLKKMQEFLNEHYNENIPQSILDENMRIIKDSYKGYMSVDDEHKDVMARQIALTAKVFIQNRGSELEDWLRVFADEDIVISKLKQI